MTQLTNRWYRDEDDLARMLALVSVSRVADDPGVGQFHAGDIIWGLFPNETIDPAARIRLFEDGLGTLRGFAWLRPPRAFDVLVDTALPDAPGTVAAIVDWVEGHLDSLPDAETDPITTELASTDVTMRELFAARGYRPVGEPDFQLNHQPLGDDLPAPELPPGAEVRPVRFDDPAEVEARVALHCEVWEPSKFSAPGYARLRGKPVYRPDLDLVAVTPAGELAAYCIVWWDPVARSGLFEPVGTATAHRRQGYGKALMRDALRRLRSLGATDAIVLSGTDSEREPSRRLYTSVGFRRVLLFESWQRRPGDQA